MSKHILLFPGGFKPFHDGHLSILESHISNMDNVHIDEIRIYISNKSRENVDAPSTLWLLGNIENKLSKLYNTNVKTKISEIVSPIRQCIIDIHNDVTGNKFCMVASNKGNDIKRKYDLLNMFSETGNHYSEEKGLQVFDIHTNIVPVKYTLRDDSYNGEFISSTIIRNDIASDNYEMFRTAYINMLNNNILTEDLLRKYFDILKNNKRSII